MLLERKRQPVQVVVDDVELVGARERVRDVERLPDASVSPGILRVAVRGDPSREPA
jgi:hypothetical protein